MCCCYGESQGLADRASRTTHRGTRAPAPRAVGTIVALDLDVSTVGYLSDVGPKLRRFFRDRDLLIRPLGNVIYLMTPYCVVPNELDRAYAAIDEGADMICEANK